MSLLQNFLKRRRSNGKQQSAADVMENGGPQLGNGKRYYPMRESDIKLAQARCILHNVWMLESGSKDVLSIPLNDYHADVPVSYAGPVPSFDTFGFRFLKFQACSQPGNFYPFSLTSPAIRYHMLVQVPDGTVLSLGGKYKCDVQMYGLDTNVAILRDGVDTGETYAHSFTGSTSKAGVFPHYGQEDIVQAVDPRLMNTVSNWLEFHSRGFMTPVMPSIQPLPGECSDLMIHAMLDLFRQRYVELCLPLLQMKLLKAREVSKGEWTDYSVHAPCLDIRVCEHALKHGTFKSHDVVDGDGNVVGETSYLADPALPPWMCDASLFANVGKWERKWTNYNKK